MNPDDVPIELRKLAVAAMNANDALPEDDQDMTPDHILAAVLPRYEALVRAQVAAEIENSLPPCDLGLPCRDNAARIARGGA